MQVSDVVLSDVVKVSLYLLVFFVKTLVNIFESLIYYFVKRVKRGIIKEVFSLVIVKFELIAKLRYKRFQHFQVAFICFYQNVFGIVNQICPTLFMTLGVTTCAKKDLTIVAHPNIFISFSEMGRTSVA